MSNLIQPQKTKLHCAWHSSVPLVSLSIVRHASTQLRKPAPIGTASLHGHLRGVSINLPSIIFNINQTFQNGSIKVLEGSWKVPGMVLEGFRPIRGYCPDHIFIRNFVFKLIFLLQNMYYILCICKFVHLCPFVNFKSDTSYSTHFCCEQVFRPCG